MTQSIEEIANQLGIEMDDKMKAFSDLIITECCNIISHTSADMDANGLESGKPPHLYLFNIRQHFGVNCNGNIDVVIDTDIE